MTLEGTNTYVVGEGPAYVIDPGPADPGHIEAIRTVAEPRGGIGGILLTHSHADHSQGAAMLEAPLMVGRIGTGSELDRRDLGVGERAEGGEVGPFTVLPTPGHAVDHVCLVLGRVCFCGDLVLGRGSSIVPPEALGGSLVDYMDSLASLGALEAELLCPGHGPWITDPAAKIADYAEHRLERERGLLAALEAGERSRARLLDEVWNDVPDPMRAAAAFAMEAHLEKLQAEGRLPDSLRD